jgi:hypothetical protein
MSGGGRKKGRICFPAPVLKKLPVFGKKFEVTGRLDTGWAFVWGLAADMDITATQTTPSHLLTA